jgi:hypothetical protein
MNKFENRYEYNKKFQEYEMKIVKMAGHLSDYYIDRALESDDFSTISGFLIDYFSGPAGKLFDVGYLVSKYKEYGLDEKIEDMDFNVDEWYKIKYEAENHVIPLTDDESHVIEMNEDEYIQYMIEKRKKEINE